MNPRHTSINNTLYLNALMLFCDYIAVLCAETTAYVTRNILVTRTHLHVPWLNYWIAFPILYIFFIGLQQLYRRRMPFYEEVRRTFYAAVYGTAGVVFILYVGKTADITSRLFICLFGILSFVYLAAVRYAVKKYFIQHEMFQTPVLLIGGGETAAILARNLTEDAGLGYRIVGLITGHSDLPPSLCHYPRLGTIEQIEEIIGQTHVSHVFIAAPEMDTRSQRQLINRIQPLVRNISVIPDLIGIPAANVEVESIIEQKIMVLGLRNNLRRPINRFIKSLFDYSVTLIGTIFISPVLLSIAAWVAIDSPGPILYRQARIGRNGRPFTCYKFRSMCIDADEKLTDLLASDPQARTEWERDRKLRSDPRITRSGEFLRRTSLDELPQIFNVLRGQMSLVGPRPIVAEELERYGEYVDDYLMVRPGITGMWQVSGRNDTDYADRVQLDSWYVRNWSVWLDMIILFKTAKAVFSQKGAY